LDIGWLDASGEGENIPLHERFYAGGPNSLRGFDYQSVGPLDANRIPLGGRLHVVWNVLEVRQSLYKMIGGVLFFEMGNVWKKPEYFTLNDFRLVAGFGIRVNTPIGLARLDYGININKRPEEASGKLYFSMGHIF